MKATVIKLGENAYQPESMPLILVKQPVYAKIIKATGLKLELMTGTHSNRPRDLWLCDVHINEERYIKAFKKSLGHQIWKTKKQNEIYFIC